MTDTTEKLERITFEDDCEHDLGTRACMAVEAFCEAWRAVDWPRMAAATQASWLMWQEEDLMRADAHMKLRDRFGHAELVRWKVGDPEMANEAEFGDHFWDVPVKVDLRARGRRETSHRVFRVIWDTDGSWGVNPPSTERLIAPVR